MKLPKIGRVFVQVLNEFLYILKTSRDDHVFKQFKDEFLLFEIFMASEDIMAASQRTYYPWKFLECTKIHSKLEQNAADFRQFHAIFVQIFAF